MKKNICLQLCFSLLVLLTASAHNGTGDNSTESTATDFVATYGIELDAPKKVSPKKAAFIVISKAEMTLSVYNFKSKLLVSYPMACGKAYGNKEKEGDMKTPEGLFSVEQIQDASRWQHDFNDGKGMIKGAYGSHFIRIKTPGHKGIGIHGTHAPESIGTRATEGCIRLRNTDLWNLLKVRKLVYVGMPVLILTSAEDAAVLPSTEECSPESEEEALPDTEEPQPAAPASEETTPAEVSEA